MPRSPSPSPRADRKRDRDARGPSRERPRHYSRERSRSRSRDRDLKRHRAADERPRDHGRDADERGTSSRHRADERRPSDHHRDRDREAGRRRDEGPSDRREQPRDRDRDRSERDRADRGDRDRVDRDRADRDRGADRHDRDGSDRHRSARDDRNDSSRRHRSRSHEPAADRGADGARLPPPPVAVKEEHGVKVEDEGPSTNGAAAGNGVHAANGAAKVKAEPLSLEELLRKKKQQAEEEAKPRFLTKKEREALALEKLAQQRASQVDGQRSSMDAMRRARQQQDDDKRREAARDAEKQRWQDERERERELELIRQQYLGAEKEKKKITKASDKYKFNFDWDNKEDTSKDLNPLYNNLHEAALLFGRGMRAGIDRREQKKQGAAYEKAAMAKLRNAAGIEETHDMRQLQKDREAAADLYDGVDMRNETHWSAKPLEDMSERDWRIFREDFNIAYRGNHSTHPIRNWDEAGLPKELRKAVDKVGYAKPSPIQMAAIPLGIRQLDVIGIAETGSGKTAAFVLPMLMYIMRQPPMTEENEADGPYAVVMAPTRELAQQIEEETIKLADFTNFRVTSVVGGQSIEEQGSKLRRGVEIVIATPGRLIDCLERHYCVLNQCNYVVLDEADRMIDLGFEPQVNGVLDAMPSSSLKPEDEGAELDVNRVYRTTYMFSATMPTAVERLARKYLRRPVVVTIGSAGRATDNVSQRVIMLKENDKAHRLETELSMVDEKRVIVFVNTKKQCDNVYSKLEELNYRCCVLHGGRTQDQREAGIKGFREDTYNVLIATDVAGRGIDVPDVALVVNYDMPNTVEAYTHRIGRTGRAGKKGQAITFLTANDTEVYYDLKRLLEDCKAPVPPELARHEAAKTKPGGVSNKRDAIQYAKK